MGRSKRGAAVFVWGVWALLSVALIGYVGFVNDDFPTLDDWHLVPVYTGQQPVTASWLWEQYNEHRLPLPKLLLIIGGILSNHDYRAGMFMSALALSALAALMITTAGRLGGGPRFADAFLPLALLHWGQYETLIISYALNLVASTVLGSLVLITIVRLRGGPTLAQGSLIGLCLLALPLCGTNGAVLVPVLAVWLAVAGITQWRSGQVHGRRDAAVMIGLAVAAAALLAVYLHSLQRLSSKPQSSAGDVARVALQFLAEGFGPLAEWRWELSGGVLGLVVLLTLLTLAREWRVAPSERLRTFGLLCFGGAMVCLAIGIGWGRGSVGTRYVTLAAPGLCLAYLVSRPAPRPLIAWGLFALFVGLLIPSTYFGVMRGERRRDQMRRLQADVASGMTPAELGAKWAPIMYHPDGAVTVAERFEMLRQARQGPYRSLPAP
jgi:hypothetical protein